MLRMTLLGIHTLSHTFMTPPVTDTPQTPSAAPAHTHMHTHAQAHTCLHTHRLTTTHIHAEIQHMLTGSPAYTHSWAHAHRHTHTSSCTHRLKCSHKITCVHCEHTHAHWQTGILRGPIGCRYYSSRWETPFGEPCSRLQSSF